MSQPPIACSLTAPGLRARRHEVLVSLAALIETERACCPFLSCQLIVEPDHGPVSLDPGQRGHLWGDVAALLLTAAVLAALTPRRLSTAGAPAA